MNWKFYLYCLFGCLFLSCYSEDKLVADKEGEGGMRYEFPQGNNSWDKDLEEIQKEFGIYIIYKDFEETDLNRSWTGALGEGSTYFGESLNDEQAEFMTKFMKNHIFAYLTPQATRKVLPMYYYMVYSFRSMGWGGYWYFGKNKFDGMDYWSICMYSDNPEEGSFYKKIVPPSTEEEYFICRGTILMEILERAVKKGTIEIPEQFHEGFDYTSAVNSYDENAENYYKRRGLPGLNYGVDSGLQRVAWIGLMNRYENVMAYILLGMKYSPEEREEGWFKYPMIQEKYEYLSNYLKTEYGLDLDAMRAGPGL